jgi:hypothetical protein
MAKRSQPLLPVTIRSVLQRAGRKLPKGQQLKVARPREREIVGGFFIVDRNKGAIIDADDDLTALARRAGLLEAWEKVDDTS